MRSIGWNFHDTYGNLPSHLYARVDPAVVTSPRLVMFNEALAHALGLETHKVDDETLAHIFSGNIIPHGASPLAQAYAGHQFGHFTYLGDGRAHLLGEHVTDDGTRVDIQLKGSGRTPYARQGDGKAALAPMLREYLMSEAMYALGVPTTRSLAVVATGEPVYRETVLQGAVLTRVAASHVRVGTLQYCIARRDKKGLQALVDYVIARHDPALRMSKTPYLDLLHNIMVRQIQLVVSWLRVGFIHGVMNTDNMALSGETIDYGPCAFMDYYDPKTVFSSIDRTGRYAYGHQPFIAQWNIARCAEAFLPLLDEDKKRATCHAEEVIGDFPRLFESAWLSCMRSKLGLLGEDKDDRSLIQDLLQWMHKHRADYTTTFRALMRTHDTDAPPYDNDSFRHWYQRWKTRVAHHSPSWQASQEHMKTYNPAIIPRNHLVEECLNTAVERHDMTPFHQFLDVLSHPYDDKGVHESYKNPPPFQQSCSYRTFCGT
ncbi:MAG: YdiU family protein [Alphaproteobacteria bacterium GM7ARS4]|nr:YdiU family protein [Alphaproteobacteria bacterium GM7ARS4]